MMGQGKVQLRAWRFGDAVPGQVGYVCGRTEGAELGARL